MKVKSTIELNYSAGREGIKKGVIEITISSYKNTDAKINAKIQCKPWAARIAAHGLWATRVTTSSGDYEHTRSTGACLHR